MGILTRFKDIMAANINALLDRAEDPEKMIDQYMRDLESDMAKVKAETASVMAEEKSAKRKLEECEAEISRMGEYAKKAVAAGNDGDARQFLEKKAELTQKMGVLRQGYESAAANAAKMREMHDKLQGDIDKVRQRKEMLKAKERVAKTQERLNGLGSSLEGAGDTMAAFDRMEEKINRRMDEAAAAAELNADKDADIDDLAAKYDSGEGTSAVDDELAKLKAEMGM